MAVSSAPGRRRVGLLDGWRRNRLITGEVEGGDLFVTLFGDGVDLMVPERMA